MTKIMIDEVEYDTDNMNDDQKVILNTLNNLLINCSLVLVVIADDKTEFKYGH